MEDYRKHLLREEKSPATLEKYLRDAGAFAAYAAGQSVTKELTIAYKQQLVAQGYALRSVNSMLAGVNGLLHFLGWDDCRVKILRYFTVEAVRSGEISVRCKSKTRRILVPGKLKRLLLDHARRRGITGGIIFRTRNGNPPDRSNLWSQMKNLCKAAGVAPSKVFPHNLRKLFARTFYHLEKDIAKLADILGHASIETTRIYIMTTGTEHRRKLERLGLLI